MGRSPVRRRPAHGDSRRPHRLQAGQAQADGRDPRLLHTPPARPPADFPDPTAWPEPAALPRRPRSRRPPPQGGGALGSTSPSPRSGRRLGSAERDGGHVGHSAAPRVRNRRPRLPRLRRPPPHRVGDRRPVGHPQDPKSSRRRVVSAPELEQPRGRRGVRSRRRLPSSARLRLPEPSACDHQGAYAPVRPSDPLSEPRGPSSRVKHCITEAKSSDNRGL
jgi:hypothetical protein